jgi:glyoxylase-like metal-dependent hydrolase (beta-lactamase superfamily II)
MDTIEQIGKRFYLLHYDGSNSNFAIPTCVAIILGKYHNFVIDTHMGESSMLLVKRFLKKHGENRSSIIFNTHYDFDHVWGNMAFQDSTIISHQKCHAKLSNPIVWDTMKQTNIHMKDGNISKVLPNLTFESKLLFTEDQVEAYWTPGHTEDSISIIDHTENICFTGDNVEAPFPYIAWPNLKRYEQSLKTYENFNTLICSHGGKIAPQLLKDNIRYIKSFSWQENPYQDSNQKQHHELIKRCIFSQNTNTN